MDRLAFTKSIVRPLAQATVILERDDTSLAEAFFVYGRIFQRLESMNERSNGDPRILR